MIGVLVALAMSNGQAPRLPEPSGPHRIGTQVFHWVDKNRADPVDKKHRRDLMIQFWYPTRQTVGTKAHYLPDKRFAKVLLERQYYLQDAAVLKSWGELKTHSFQNAKPDAAQKWPILLFEPGLGMPRENYTAFCEDLASHGYFVAAIDPTRGGLAILPNGRILDASDDPAYNDPGKQHAKTVEWAEDDAFVLTEIAKRAHALSVDVRHVGALGHSMGGSSALQAVINDRRIDAALDMDGSGGVEGLERGAPAPMLFLKSNPNYSDEDLAKLHRTRAQWEAMGKNGPKMFPPLAPGISSKPVYQFSIRDTGHLSYSDAPFLFPNTITRFSNHSLEANRTLKVTMEITRGFFDHYLKDKAWSVPYVKELPWPEVEFVKLYG